MTKHLTTALLLFFMATMPRPLMGEVTGPTEPHICLHLEQAQIDKDYKIAGESVVSHYLLAKLYQDRNMCLLWKKPESVMQLINAIQESWLEGLTPADYHLGALQRLQQQIREGINYPTLRANFDLLLTDAFIRLAYDKSFGKVDPKRLNSTWNLPEKTIADDPVEKIDTAIENGKVGEILAELSPDSPLYQHLKQALAGYRTLKKRGGWPKVPNGSLLKLGVQDKRVLALRKRLLVSGELAPENSSSPLFDGVLRQAVADFQKRHYLHADGIVGKQTLAALNQSVEDKINQIRVNLERARWILHDIPETFVLVDIAGYTLSYHVKGKLIWSTGVVVGLPYHKTPVFESAIRYLVLNPTWTIPRSIIGRETLPKIKKNPNYLQEHNLRVLDFKGNSVDPTSIPWEQYSGKSLPYMIRQNPGPHNALGRVKFIFPNKHAIYLHDTPHRELFSRDQRAFSHGCIRVEQPLTLAELILQHDGQNWDQQRFAKVIEGGKITRVNLKTPLRVFLLYWTVDASVDGGIRFKHDMYGRDQALLQALDGAFKIRDDIPHQIEKL